MAQVWCHIPKVKEHMRPWMEALEITRRTLSQTTDPAFLPDRLFRRTLRQSVTLAHAARCHSLKAQFTLRMDRLTSTPSGPTLSPNAVNAFRPATILISTSAQKTLLRLIGWLTSTLEFAKESRFVPS